MNFNWGILGPGQIESTRRVRTLGLAAATRDFNERAVPGLGSVWFGRQLFLATLGVLVADRAAAAGVRVSCIAAANAIEALACWLALRQGTKSGESRIRGSTRLVGQQDMRFRMVNRPGFYVSQPMRMSTVSALPALGFVDSTGSRFNSFTCNAHGEAFVEAITEGCKPYNQNLLDYLVRWVRGEDLVLDSSAMRRALSPVLPLPLRARALLHARLVHGATGEPPNNRIRRGDALRWVRSRNRGAQPVTWTERPAEITSNAHWADLHAGALFFIARDAASAVLEQIEQEIGTQERRFDIGVGVVLSPLLAAELATLRKAAQAFLATEHQTNDAQTFCSECATASDTDVIKRLVERDGRILRLVGTQIGAGPAFRGGQRKTNDDDAATDTAPPADDPAWPEGLSRRIHNLWWLGLDLEGRMNEWLQPSSEKASHA